ncbi:MAG: serine--tRNA ligase [Nitrospina sp.]|jgi:seryl-tRNA synthetase|nr:serine--tRNA ligase [Nitrospina sp.]MBT6718259.1 serine--tRNA ligase [Nitrospina sp.]
MLDIKFIRENLQIVKTGLDRRNGSDHDLEALLEQEDKRRQGLQESEQLKNKKKKLSAEVGKLKQQGQDASQLMEEVKNLNASIKELDEIVEGLENIIHEKLLGIPNLPDENIPDGRDESSNKFIREWGSKPSLSTQPLNHVEIGEKLGLIDLKRAAKISGARFAVYRGAGAALLRALINFMIDVQTQENGYEELYPPFLVNEESLLGTGQLPKFKEDLFAMADDPLYLIPTAEVPVTNFHREEILEEESLPICYTAYTPCFRREAGSYGKDTQGLIRQHQFDKVELVKFSKASESVQELEKLVQDAETILQKLNLHYRVMELCVGDLGFSASKTYDLEVWLPSQNTYREISSCSNFRDYQARRAKIRCKKRTGGKPEFVNTLNGSGLAAGRLFVAILENYQNDDGTVTVPEAIRPYLKGREVLSP